MMWGFVQPPQPAVKANVNRYLGEGSITLHCRACHASVEWMSGGYSQADVWWWEQQHRHEPTPKGKR